MACSTYMHNKGCIYAKTTLNAGEKPYECDICGKKFKYRNQIPKHRRAHTGEKPYQCTTCEKRFTSNIHLTRHIRTHTGERPYKCTTCDKAFTQFGHLQVCLCRFLFQPTYTFKIPQKNPDIHLEQSVAHSVSMCFWGILKVKGLEK